MTAMLPLPPLKRVPLSTWTALAWGAGLVFTFLIRLRLPGEEEATVLPGVVFYRWDGLVLLTVGTALALWGCRLLAHRPVAAIGRLLAASVVATAPLSVGEIPLGQFLAVDVALYVVAATRPRRTGIVALAMALGTLAGYLTVRLVCGWNVGTSAELAVAMTAAIAWLIGNSTHQAREYAEKSRAQAAAQAVTVERLRIAREMHDTVAHSIGIIALQAGAAARVIETQPAAAREALVSIENAGRETLAGLRRMLGALRQAEPAAEGHERESAYVAPVDPVFDTAFDPPRVPALGLADVDRLAAATTAAGVRVDVRWHGEPRPLPPEIDISAYRVIQEAVTNVVRHSGTRTCLVTVDSGAEELSIEITDDGRGEGRRDGRGWGLVGMRERVTLLHGDFSAEPRPEGGFRVTARLPVPAGAR